MTDLDLAALRAKAEAATPGPWSIRFGSDGEYAGQIEPNITRWNGISGPATFGKANAAFIVSAQPRVVIALIERCDAAEAERTLACDELGAVYHEIARLRALLARAGEALKSGVVAIPARVYATSHEELVTARRMVEGFDSTARTIAREIEEALK